MAIYPKVHAIDYDFGVFTLCRRRLENVTLRTSRDNEVNIYKNGRTKILATTKNSKVTCVKCQEEL